MRIIRVADQVLLFDGTGRLVDGVQPEVVEGECLARLRLDGEFVGLYPVTVRRRQEQEQAPCSDRND